MYKKWKCDLSIILKKTNFDISKDIKIKLSLRLLKPRDIYMFLFVIFIPLRKIRLKSLIYLLNLVGNSSSKLLGVALRMEIISIFSF